MLSSAKGSHLLTLMSLFNAIKVKLPNIKKDKNTPQKKKKTHKAAVTLAFEHAKFLHCNDRDMASLFKNINSTYIYIYTSNF